MRLTWLRLTVRRYRGQRLRTTISSIIVSMNLLLITISRLVAYNILYRINSYRYRNYGDRQGWAQTPVSAKMGVTSSKEPQPASQGPKKAHVLGF